MYVGNGFEPNCDAATKYFVLYIFFVSAVVVAPIERATTSATQAKNINKYKG